MSDDPEARLLRRMMDARLPPEEPISRWIAEPDYDTITIQVEDDTLLLEDGGGLVEYHVLRDGQVEVKDYRDPRSMRYQRYDPKRPGQPMMMPSVEDDSLPRVDAGRLLRGLNRSLG